MRHSKTLMVWMVAALICAGLPPVAAQTVSAREDAAELLPEVYWQPLMHFARAALNAGEGQRVPFPGGPDRDRRPRVVIFSVSDGLRSALSVTGRGPGYEMALRDAVLKAREGWGREQRPRWIRCDFVSEIYKAEISEDAPGSFRRKPLEGLAFGKVGRRTFILSDQFSAFGLLGKRGQVDEAKLKSFLEDKPGSTRKAYRFNVFTLFDSGRQVMRLERGHQMFTAPAPETLMAAAESAGRYLSRHVDKEGRFLYVYDAGSGKRGYGYNMLRHAGTVYAMGELATVSTDPNLRPAAERALKFLVHSVRPCTFRGKSYRCLVEDGQVKLGGNALAILAMVQHAEVTGDKSHVPLMMAMAQWILDVQNDEGEFPVHRMRHPRGSPDIFRSEYYPGEAVFALSRLYTLTGAQALLESAERGARWLIETRDGDKQPGDLSHDHWLLYGMNELYRHRSNAIYVRHALKLSGAIIQAQHRNSRVPDWEGGFYRPPRSTATATRAEGLLAAHALLLSAGEDEAAARILEAAALAIRFQLQTQVRPETSLFLAEPRRAMGGFTESLGRSRIRIDYVQHNLSALLAYQAAGAGDSEATGGSNE